MIQLNCKYSDRKCNFISLLDIVSLEVAWWLIINVQCFTADPPNIAISHETCFQSRSLKLITKVFPYHECHATLDVSWTVNGKKIDKQGMGGKYSTVSVDDPSLTIHNVNYYDAGLYKLTATNAVGTTISDAIEISI